MRSRSVIRFKIVLIMTQQLNNIGRILIAFADFLELAIGTGAELHQLFFLKCSLFRILGLFLQRLFTLLPTLDK